MWSATGVYSRPASFYYIDLRYFNVSELLLTVLYKDDTCIRLGGKYIENIISCLNKQ